MRNDFAAFILTHGRPDNVITYNTLIKQGYTGKIYIIVDDTDKTITEYKKRYGDKVIVFNKKEIAKTFDTGDNFNDMRTIVYARNACFGIAKRLNIKYFIQLDDDYTGFFWQFDGNKNFDFKPIKKSMDEVFQCLLDFYINTSCDSIAMAQGGDFIGGEEGHGEIEIKRKCMNSFTLSTERPFKFIGRINEDVNTYTRKASTGLLLFTTKQISLRQKQTQSNKGGMTDVYLSSGTYLKSFYSVMYSPSSVKITLLNSRHKRLHHQVAWNNAVPLVVNEQYKKQ